MSKATDQLRDEYQNAKREYGAALSSAFGGGVPDKHAGARLDAARDAMELSEWRDGVEAGRRR